MLRYFDAGIPAERKSRWSFRLLSVVGVAAAVSGGLAGCQTGHPTAGPSLPPSASPTPVHTVSPAPVPSISTSVPPVVVKYQPPVTITKGGTYTGNWASDNPDIPAVYIKTTEPVVLHDCHLRGTGDLISNSTTAGTAVGADVTVQGCTAEGLDPGQAGRARGEFIAAVFPRRLVVENNTWQHTRGIGIIGDKGDCISNFVSLNGLLKVPDMEIGWNELIDDPRQSSGEDHISLYNASGTPGHELLVHDNYIQGAYPSQPDKMSGYSGTGINSDGDGVADAAHSTGNVKIYGNAVVSADNAGIGAAAGHDVEIFDNRVVSSGQLPGGKTLASTNVGLAIWDCCYNQVARGVMTNVYAHDNVIGYNWVDSANKTTRRSDTKFDDCSRDSSGASKCVRNQSLSGEITLAPEKVEYVRWQAKLTQSAVALGAA